MSKIKNESNELIGIKQGKKGTKYYEYLFFIHIDDMPKVTDLKSMFSLAGQIVAESYINIKRTKEFEKNIKSSEYDDKVIKLEVCLKEKLDQNMKIVKKLKNCDEG